MMDDASVLTVDTTRSHMCVSVCACVSWMSCGTHCPTSCAMISANLSRCSADPDLRAPTARRSRASNTHSAAVCRCARCLPQVPESLVHTFDMVCIDPPFITEDVWAQYAATVRRLLAPGGKILLSTIPESAEFLTRLLCVHAVNWRPAIPNLIYQYSLFVNYDSERFRWFNPEIDAEAAERQAKEGGDGSETTAVQWTSRKKCTMEGFGSERYQN